MTNKNNEINGFPIRENIFDDEPGGEIIDINPILDLRRERNRETHLFGRERLTPVGHLATQRRNRKFGARIWEIIRKQDR